jgi:hypothetical protein
LHHGQYQSRRRIATQRPATAATPCRPAWDPPPSALRSHRPTACLGLFSFAARLPRLPPSPDAG